MYRLLILLLENAIIKIMKSEQIKEIVADYCIRDFGKEYRDIVEGRLEGIKLYQLKYADQRVLDESTKDFMHGVVASTVSQGAKIDYESVYRAVHAMTTKVAGGQQMGWAPFLTGYGEDGIYREFGHASFVCDLNDTGYSHELVNSLSDQFAIHELLHNITQYIKDNMAISGVTKGITPNQFTEWLINQKAIEIAKAIHADGIRFNEKVIPNDDLAHALSPILQRKAHLNSFYHENKRAFTPAMLVGDYGDIHKALGGRVKYEEFERKF